MTSPEDARATDAPPVSGALPLPVLSFDAGFSLIREVVSVSGSISLARF